jgi:2-oxoisovalerate dehydrogenase E1 component
MKFQGLNDDVVYDQAGRPVVLSDDAAIYAFGSFLRSTERLILDLFGRGLLSGTTHTCLGQELCQLSVVRSLRCPDDVVLSNHRNHGHFLSYSGNALGLVAEIMGREAGICGGHGGSQHIAWKHFHSNGIQAGMTGIGVGLALERKLRGAAPAVVSIMIGDGTLGEGLLYEAMNLAAVWNVPALFVVEHNAIAQTTETAQVLAGSPMVRAQGFGLVAAEFDDANPEFIHQVESFVDRVRQSQSPAMLVIHTRRLGPHSKGDDLRPAEELAYIRSRDPLEALGRRLDAELRTQIDQSIEAHLKEVEAVALASSLARFAPVPKHSYRLECGESQVPPQSAKAVNVRGALNQALDDLLSHDDRVLMLGEDLHDPYGGAFKVAAGLSSKHAGRVISTPISEAGITGAGIGLALAGRRPIVEIMFADFVTLCADQLYNHAVKFPGMFDDCSVPLVMRTPCGGRRGYGPTHSQSPENLLCAIPGLTVVYASHRHNVGQLLVNASQRWDNPTLFLEHKLLYGLAQDPADYEVLPAHEQDAAAALFPTLRAGSRQPDVCLVSFGGMLSHVEAAAKLLREQEELEVEIVAPSLLAPLPRQGLIEALIDRPFVVVVEESHVEYGVAAEILASMIEEGFDGQVSRFGTPPAPIAAARSLEEDQIPDASAIVSHVLARI